jgi:[ribosomal protein S5]-alanine N-acetyltransferase
LGIKKTITNMTFTISTKHLTLIPCNIELLNAAVMGDQSLSSFLNVSVEPGWNGFGPEVFKHVISKITDKKKQEMWWTYFTVYKSENILIGNGGFKGHPDSRGLVEIGYEIAPSYRNQGLATEMANSLIEFAFSHIEVKGILAHTLGEENASTRVLTNCGFSFQQETLDPDDGIVWEWILENVGSGKF